MADSQPACASRPLARQPKPWPGQRSGLREEFHLGMEFFSQSRLGSRKKQKVHYLEADMGLHMIFLSDEAGSGF